MRYDYLLVNPGRFFMRCESIDPNAPVTDGSRPVVTCELSTITTPPVDPEPTQPTPTPDPTKLCGTPPLIECCATAGSILIEATEPTGCACGLSVLGTGIDPAKTLTPSVGTLIITQDNATIDCIDHLGCVIIRANNVTITNSRIVCNLGAAAIRQEAIYSGAQIIDNTIEGTTAGSGAGISGGNFTATGNDISGTVDGIQITGGNATVTGNYIHDLRVVTLSGGGISHNDGIQILDGSNILIANNVILGEISPSHNSAIFAQSDFGPIFGLTIRDNFVESFGFTLRFNNDVIGIIRNNTVGISPLPQFGPIAITGGAAAAVECNVWEDGTLITEASNTCSSTPTPIDFDALTVCRC